MANNGKVLNLDELFGTDHPVVVVLGGERYELRRPKALTPVEFDRWMKLQGKLKLPGGSLEEIGTNWTEDTGKQVEDLVNDVLALLNPTLAKNGDLTFMMKVQVLEFYTKEVFPDQLAAAEKQLAGNSKNLTGA